MLPVMRHKQSQFTRYPAVISWHCLFPCIFRALLLSAAISRHTDRPVHWAPALDYKAQICLGTHGSELSNKTCGFLPGTAVFVEPTLWQTDGEERTTKEEGIAREQSLVVQWNFKFTLWKVLVRTSYSISVYSKFFFKMWIGDTIITMP